jgi:hypothetical protein
MQALSHTPWIADCAKRLLGVLLMAVSCAALAQRVGEVEFARGVGFAQAAGQLPRTLGKGLPLQEGDRLTIAEDSAAIIKLNDGTRMTLRPNSELVVHQYQFKEGASDNSMNLQLLRGGLRAITGLISKNSPNAARIQTVTTTVGIRGTDFDARLCGPECRAESAKVPDAARLNVVTASAKLVAAQGSVHAIDLSKTRRLLVDGASVYAGETVETGSGATGVLIFQDDSRISLGANTQFRVDSFVFDAKNPKEGNFLVSLLQGSMRALTGLIGKSNTRNVRLNTPTAVIGIRGTGLDLDCATPESCSFFTWLGSIEVTQNGQTALQVLEAGKGLFVSRTEIRVLTGPTLENLQRPDTVPADLKQLFGTVGITDQNEGLFVFVRDGHIQITSDRETLHLGRGEAGFAGSDGLMGRPVTIPLFIQYDKMPMPNSANPMLINVMGEIGKVSNNLCP